MAKKRKPYKDRNPSTFEGLPVVDSSKDLELHILPQDVKGADKKNPASCAAARACKREFRTDARVFLTRTYVKQKDHWVRFITPPSISREIVAFDRGASFEPGSYTVKAPSVSNRLSNHRGYSRKRETPVRKARPHKRTVMVREKAHYDREK